LPTPLTAGINRFIAILWVLAFQITALSANDADGEPFKLASTSSMATFEPYIGRWISPPRDGQLGKSQFIIEYRWFDANKSVVKLFITLRVEGEDQDRAQWEGFYGVHPIDGYIYYHGVNVGGRSAIGGVVEFDIEKGTRTSFYQGKTPDGEIMNVRDSFSVIDQNSWRSVTSLKPGAGEWQTASDTVYTKIEE